jgi:SPP1 gp7 family putative phage head morphogenesis protein
MCVRCGNIENVKKPRIFTDEEAEKYIYRLYSGLITTNSLDVAAYKKVGEHLTNGVFNGFGANIANVEYGTPDYKMLFDLRRNVYVFSGAKQYQQVRLMSSFLTNESGIVPFNQFKKVALDAFETYNVNYLYAEYNLAISSGRSASMWMEYEQNADIMPYLTYKTVGDGRVRPEHQVLNNITRKIDDKFWSLYFPPNDWNCRCTVIQSDEGVLTDMRTFKSPDSVPELFRMNAGKDRIVYSKKHPYFKVEKGDKELAKKNFDLPIPY